MTGPAGAPSQLPHMPQLDGLRAYAVMAVLLHHLLDVPILPEALAPNWGLIGVRLFFVLSGYLITGLLIQAMNEARAGELSSSSIIARFYARRALRIFPVYYLVLLATLLFGPPDAREQVPWLATYTYNFRISALGWYPDYFAHFWSLCVEEQFYLLWPCIVVFAPRRYLAGCAIAMIVAAPLYRWAAVADGVNAVAMYTLTPSSLDALGIGALLALGTRGQPASPALDRALRLTALPAACGGLLLLSGWETANSVLLETLVAVIFVALIAGASRGYTGWARFALEARPIAYLGKISYGVYVYHLLVPYLLNASLRSFGVEPLADGVARFGLCSTATIALASLSWHVLERPMNRLKDHVRGGIRPVARGAA